MRFFTFFWGGKEAMKKLKVWAKRSQQLCLLKQCITYIYFRRQAVEKNKKYEWEKSRLVPFTSILQLWKGNYLQELVYLVSVCSKDFTWNVWNWSNKSNQFLQIDTSKKHLSFQVIFLLRKTLGQFLQRK